MRECVLPQVCAAGAFTHIFLANGGAFAYTVGMNQIAFNEISAAEVSAIPTLEQLELFFAFKVDEKLLKNPAADSEFGVMERNGTKLYRFRTAKYRIYFTIEGGVVVVQRVLAADSLKDFMYRSGLSEGNEDHELSKSRTFWKLIEDGEHAKRKSGDAL